MSTALELADKLELEWRNNALNYDTALDSAIELRRLAEIERQYLALKASIGEPVGGYWWNTESLQTKMIEKGQVWTASDKWVFIGSLYAIKDNQP
jgi:hypothetical protein